MQCLHNQGCVVEIFYIAAADGDDLENDLLTRSQFPWLVKQVKFHRSSDAPNGFCSTLTWHAKGIWHALFGQSKATTSNPKSMRLPDFNWPWALAAFDQAVRRFQPDAVIVEYVKLAYLLDAKAMDGSQSPATFLDSHDLLFRRYESFAARGQSHWIEITEQEEAAVFQRFDTVIGIQADEAKKIRQMVPETDVIVCTHACYPSGLHPNVDQFRRERSEYMLRLGILSSNNPANRSAIQSLMTNVWAPLFGNRSDVDLLIAGSVCDGIPESSRGSFSNVQWKREIDTPSSFYKQVDVVVNPIEFGSGLKIKNVESLAHGKPLITTTHGATGLIDEPNRGVFVADTAQEWQLAVEQLLADGELENLSTAAAALSKTRFSETAAYGSLLGRLSIQAS